MNTYLQAQILMKKKLKNQQKNPLYMYIFLPILISLSVIVEQATIYIHNYIINKIKMITLYINHNKRQ